MDDAWESYSKRTSHVVFGNVVVYPRTYNAHNDDKMDANFQ